MNGAFQFYDPGADVSRIDAGTSSHNLFYRNSNGTYSGRSYGSSMTISWIGRNQ